MRNNRCNQNQRVNSKNVLIFYIFVLFFTLALNPGYVYVYGREQNQEQAVKSNNSERAVSINIESIIQLVFGENPEVVAIRYALEAAEFQFKDFVRNLSQFTPLLLRSAIARDQRQNEEGQVYSTRVGMEKEFFDGSSIFTGVGHRGHFGDTESGKGQFLETDITFPLFGSYTTLRRITNRSREENELLNARLEYVDTIRDNIRMAQFNYIDLQTQLERMAMRKECIEAYKGFLTIPRVQSNPVERQQIETAIQSEEADMVVYDQILNNILIRLRFSIGQEELLLSQVNSFDLYAKDYYGKSYLSRTVDELLDEADRNDINIRVLENARKSSYEKKRLAEEGKWDVFLDFSAQYDINGDGTLRDDNGYLIGLGLRITKIDPVLLGYSLSRAVAEINKYTSLIRAQQLRTKNQIDREWFTARNRRKQFEELFASVESQRRVYLQKRKDYAEGKETIDNLIDSRKQIMLTQMTLSHSLEGLYSSISRLDHACGVYFTKLGINLEGFYEEERIPGTKFSIPFK
jgi:outer membrane protein TolC